MQIFLGLMATVMVVAGMSSVLFGPETLPNEGRVTPDVDTEFRFYAVWYVAAGVLLARSIARVEISGETVKIVGAGFFLAGCARLLSWATVGRPYGLALVLMVIELLLPFVIVPWQVRVAAARRSE